MANLITISTPQSPSLSISTSNSLTLTTSEWGSIAGDIEDQTDLQESLTAINNSITNSVNSINEAISLLQQAISLKEALLGFTPENVANKGVASGYAPLNADSKIPIEFILSQGISFFTNYSSFPLIGEPDTLYIDKSSLSLYLWNGIQYFQKENNFLTSLNFSNSTNSQYFSLMF